MERGRRDRRRGRRVLEIVSQAHCARVIGEANAVRVLKGERLEGARSIGRERRSRCRVHGIRCDGRGGTRELKRMCDSQSACVVRETDAVRVLERQGLERARSVCRECLI